MKQKIKPQDAPKIAVALAVLLALGGAGWMKMQGAAGQNEQARAIAQMERESGGAFISPSLSIEEADEAASKQREADPDFVH